MKTTYIFPILMILFDIGAAVLHAVNSEYQKTIYWFAAAVLNAAVTF